MPSTSNAAPRPPAPFTVEQIRDEIRRLNTAAATMVRLWEQGEGDHYYANESVRMAIHEAVPMLQQLAQSLETAGWRPIADKVYVVIEHSDYEHHPIVAAFATEAAALACIERLDAYAKGAPELTAEFNDDAWDAQLDARQAYFKACPDWPNENMHDAVEFHVQHVPLPPSRPEERKTPA